MVMPGDGSVTSFELVDGEHAERSVAASAVVPDLETLEDRCRAARPACATRTTRSGN
jgi:hypothetical protein